ncbi:MAG: hypothetical protein ACE5WD_10070, partial [Candidatus Aminicenantia bacterium]
PVLALWAQEVNIEPNTSYDFRVFIKTKGVVGDVYPILSFSDNSGNQLYRNTLTPLVETNNWTECKFRFKPLEIASKIWVLLAVTCEKGTVWFDDVFLGVNSDFSYQTFMVDLNKKQGEVKTFLQVNGGPIDPEGRRVDLTWRFQEIGIEYVRTHDWYGPGDIHQIFPDLSKDPNNPANYNFAETDTLIEAVKNAGCDILFRLGESWEDPPVHNKPPSDFEKWADVCVHIIKHYNEGWANGYQYGIKYWEIWNEPDIVQFWDGPLEEYYKLYEITAKKIKQYDKTLKVGGPCLANPFGFEFIDGFLNYVKQTGAPLDFFSWHLYWNSNPYSYVETEQFLENRLASHNFQNVEIINTEWGIISQNEFELVNIYHSPINSSIIGAVFAYMQPTRLIKLFRYRVDGYFLGLWDDNGNYYYPGLAFKAISEFKNTPILLKTQGGDNLGTTIIAAKSLDNTLINILLSDYASPSEGYRVILKNLPTTKPFLYQCFRIDYNHELELIKEGRVVGSEFTISLPASSPYMELIKISIPEKKGKKRR